MFVFSMSQGFVWKPSEVSLSIWFLFNFLFEARLCLKIVWSFIVICFLFLRQGFVWKRFEVSFSIFVLFLCEGFVSKRFEISLSILLFPVQRIYLKTVSSFVVMFFLFLCNILSWNGLKVYCHVFLLLCKGFVSKWRVVSLSWFFLFLYEGFVLKQFGVSLSVFPFPCAKQLS